MKDASNHANSAKPGLALAALAFAQLITSLDFNIVYVALPDIGTHLGFSARSQQWAFSSYSVVFGGFILLGGRAADLYGRRRMFIVGLVLYAVSSMLGGLASTPAAMIAARGLQGAGGAFLFPATLSLVNTLFEEGKERNRALGLWSLAGSSGLTLGSLIGGLLVGALGWRWVFFVNVPIACLVGAAALAAIPGDGPKAGSGRLDLLGAAISTTGVTLLVLTLVEAPEWGWGSATTLAAGLLSVALLGLFLVIESRTISPLMPLAMLRRPSLAAAMAMTFMFMGTFMALPYFTTELFQTAFKFTPFETGLAFLVPCLAIAAGTQIGSRLAARTGAKALLACGLIVGAIGAALTAIAIERGQGYGSMVPGLIVFGLGQGTAWPPMWIMASAGIAPEEQGIASGIASTTLWIGGAAGLAVLVAMAGIAPGGATAQTADLVIESSVRAVAAIAVGILLSLPIVLVAKWREERSIGERDSSRFLKPGTIGAETTSAPEIDPFTNHPIKGRQHG